MKVFWQVFLIFGCAIVATITLFEPNFLGTNDFLKLFVSHEILAFLIIIVTITFGSVANIHLSISRTQTTISNAETRKQVEEQFAKPLRDETQSSAWMLFWALIICVVALFIKGSCPTNMYVVSAVHGIAILVLIANAVVLYDIYGAIFELVGLDNDKTPIDPI
jgi:hypothetical protein